MKGEEAIQVVGQLMATVNLFSAINSDQDQFRPPKKRQRGARDGSVKGVGKRESLAEGTLQRFRAVQGVRVKKRGPSGEGA